MLVKLGIQPGKISCKSSGGENVNNGTRMQLLGTKAQTQNMKGQIIAPNVMLYLLEEERQGEAGRDLQQEHQGLLGDTQIQEHTDQMPQGVLAGFVGSLDTEGAAPQFGK